MKGNYSSSNHFIFSFDEKDVISIAPARLPLFLISLWLEIGLHRNSLEVWRELFWEENLLRKLLPTEHLAMKKSQ